jgi:superfamily II DNA or RNA helicase
LSEGYKVLWLAHTHHLLEQAFIEFGNGVAVIAEPKSELNIRVVSGTPGHFPVRDIRVTDDVIIGTLQTIREAYERRHPQLESFLGATQGKLLVVFDEAHHSPAPSYRKLMFFLRERWPQMVLLGLTATPTYEEERKRPWLTKLFPQGILHQETPQKLMAAGILARPVTEEHRTEFAPGFDEREFQKWVATNRDVPEDIIAELAANHERNDFIVDQYVNHKDKYLQTIIFADRWWQCERMRERLLKRGVKADVIYSHIDADPGSVEARNRRGPDENAKVLRAFKEGDLDVLINVRMLTEGTDVPQVRTVFLTRQTTSSILLTQMVGRALRGPRAGGKSEAYIVSFLDNWKHLINWAGYDQIAGGLALDDVTEYGKRPPLHIISIELVRRLARMMESGVTMAPVPFLTMLPIGWYRLAYTARVQGTDENECINQLVMVYENEREGYEKYIESLFAEDLSEFEKEEARLDELRPSVDGWLHRFFPNADERLGGGLSQDLFAVARHVAENRTPPKFFPFEERDRHDLDAVAKDFLAKRLDPYAVDGALRLEYNSVDRFWKTMYITYYRFKSQYDACVNRLLRAEGPDAGPVAPPFPYPPGETPTPREPSEEVKGQVRERDGNQCVCCGSTRRLRVDHIVPYYYGGGNILDNLQTLCEACNVAKGMQTINFRDPQTDLTSPPVQFPQQPLPDEAQAGDIESWVAFLRRQIAFFYKCAAVQNVLVKKRGAYFRAWNVELKAGNDPEWLAPHLEGLLTRIRGVREQANLAAPEQLVVWAPDKPSVAFVMGQGIVREAAPGQDEGETVEAEPLDAPQENAARGDWFFNTCETYHPGAYVQMLKKSVIVVSGYDNSEEMLNKLEPGDRVFAYMNRCGIIAVGTVGTRKAYSSGTVWHRQNKREFHRRVSWDIIVEPQRAVPASEIRDWGFSLPVRKTLCKISSRGLAEKLTKELERRAAAPTAPADVGPEIPLDSGPASDAQVPPTDEPALAPSTETEPKRAPTVKPQGPAPANSEALLEPDEEPPPPIGDTDRDERMPTIRRVFGDGQGRDRETAIRDLARALGYRRVGPNIREILEGDLLAAVRRRIVWNDGGTLRMDCRGIDEYDRELLKQAVLSVVGRAWQEREDTIRAAARRLGFARTGERVEKAFNSTVRGLLRTGRLESDGQWIRATRSVEESDSR